MSTGATVARWVLVSGSRVSSGSAIDDAVESPESWPQWPDPDWGTLTTARLPSTSVTCMARRMRDPIFRSEQHARLGEKHIAPVTTYVDSLRTDQRWLPYVAPLHGGVNSRMLTVLRDPGKGTLHATGSGMLCIENDDQTAETQFLLMDAAGLTPADFTPWNAYPWFIDRAPTLTELREASPTLAGLLELLPDLEVVLLQGGDAQRAWEFVSSAHPAIGERGLTVLATYHPSVQALRTPSAHQREARRRDRVPCDEPGKGCCSGDIPSWVLTPNCGGVSLHRC